NLSDRTSRGPRQRVVAWLGVMDERGRLGVKRCAEKNTAYQTGLFTTTEPDWVEVDVKRVRVERSRKFGGPWLGRESDTPRRAGGLVSGAASKAVVPLVEASRLSATPQPTGQPPLRRPHSPSHPLCGGCLTLSSLWRAKAAGGV